MTTLRTLCKHVKITSTHGKTALPWEKQNGWQRDANGYRVKLAYQGRSYSLDFWQGSAITEDPTTEGVLECLLSDAASADESFSEWCASFGYDEDSRKAEATYKACKAVGVSLRRLLGKDYDRFQASDR